MNVTSLIALIGALTALVAGIGSVVSMLLHVRGPAHNQPAAAAPPATAASSSNVKLMESPNGTSSNSPTQPGQAAS